MSSVNKRENKHGYPKRLATFPENFAIAGGSSAPGASKEELAENGFKYLSETEIECEYCKFKCNITRIRDPIKGICSAYSKFVSIFSIERRKIAVIPGA